MSGIGIIFQVIKFVASQWLVLGFGLAAVLAYLFPHVAASGGVLESQVTFVYGAVSVIFFVSGLQLSQEKLKRNATNWRLHFTTQGISFLVIPAIQLAIIHIAIAAGCLRTGTPDISILVGMVVVSCLPTTIASNIVMTRAAGGDDGAAIIEVVIGNVLGSFLSPLLIYAYLPKTGVFESWQPASPTTFGVMYANVTKQLSLSVLLPLAAGQAIRWLWADHVDTALKKFYLGKLPTLCLCLLIWMTFSNAFSTGALESLPKTSVIFNVFLNVASYLLFTAICLCLARPPTWFTKTGSLQAAASADISRQSILSKKCLKVTRMPKVQTIAICFCGAAKTTSLGIPIVGAMWLQADIVTKTYIQIPVLLYAIEQVFVGQFLVYLFKWYVSHDKERESGTQDVELDSTIVTGSVTEAPSQEIVTS